MKCLEHLTSKPPPVSPHRDQHGLFSGQGPRLATLRRLHPEGCEHRLPGGTGNHTTSPHRGDVPTTRPSTVASQPAASLSGKFQASQFYHYNS